MTDRRPHITDHAIIRFLERVHGIDVQAARAEIEARVGQAVRVGACAVISGGFRYVIDDVRVTSVVPVQSGPSHPPRPIRENSE